MELRGKRVLVCDCEKTMPLDGDKLAKACRAAGAEGSLEISSQLCRAQLGRFQRAARDGAPLLVACTQEAPLFGELAAEQAAEAEAPEPELGFFNIRETAGWSEAARAATPKLAALIAAATVELDPAPTVTMTSEGTCLVYGRDERALEAAERLKDRLEVTVLLSEAEDLVPPRRMEVPVFKGRIVSARGHLGAFAVTVDGYAAAQPSARAAFAFEAPRNNAYSECDLILDLTGGTPLFPAHERRDGYFRPDPDSPAAVQQAIFEAADYVGEFEKPRYVRYDPTICAHSRSRKTGCTRCLDLCPTSAITPAGDTVEFDPFVCAGCGQCAAACPTGAASYALPGPNSLIEKLKALLEGYRAAGGRKPVVLVHDGRHGEETIHLMARLGRGLPAEVLPIAVNQTTQLGVDFLASALAYGAAQIVVLIDPRKRDELGGIAGQIGLVETLLDGLGYGGGRVLLIDDADPSAVEDKLWRLRELEGLPAGSFLPLGGKRTRTLLALRHLHDEAPEPRKILPLAKGAPFGAVAVDTAGCTLCLACVGACPTGALMDAEDRPWLGFTEEACVQCGLCRNTCPEQVITLEPRLNFGDEARGAVTLNQAEPFNCVRCGKPFGVERSIERVAEQLAGRHSMFLESGRIERILMCEDCRVITEMEDQDNPLRGAERPRTRTTEDYLRERELAERGGNPEGGGSVH
ncbi:4Fe-4S dicluster domain-containing protein [Tistlia consotensis]|uniref:4Fe-4S dicluster domain-containing protein n=1 Tax=Tistlia consotensis USBA 355 TaxID=560819 RepID=A0A1Y6CWD0_9PROT|nr:4Fe-4S dicluster domain-containing protein [Tistlia consotensis]SMF82385.1 4Fe-4S dicluster domain-containing protein [Tistlia consotensis USBA 355]SNS27367.1 4Fe-4S dicluster domain-containing protein [Tistlia consotensis]